MFPLSLPERPAIQNPRYWVAPALGAAAVTGIAAAARRGGRAGNGAQA
jgi:hypothetical protein